MVKITKVLKQNESDSVVEVQITLTTVIREGRDTPDMSFNGVPINDEDFILAVHHALENDKIMVEEIDRILG